MNESDHNWGLAKGFLLGMQVFAHASDVEYAASAKKGWDLLVEISEGRQTLIQSAAEWALSDPDMPDAMKAETPKYTGMMINAHQDMGRRILILMRMRKSEDA